MTRNQDAIAIINLGACNPSGIAVAIIKACRECREVGLGTQAICRDPAIRLMVHQMAYLCATPEIDQSDDLLSKLMADCQETNT